jgi:hypothetical protein
VKIDDETLHELDSPHERIDQPLITGLRTSAPALLGFALAAIPYFIRFNEHASEAAWFWIMLIPVGIVSLSFSYAFLGSRYGRRVARRIIGGGVAVAAIVGLYALTRYTSSQ